MNQSSIYHLVFDLIDLGGIYKRIINSIAHHEYTSFLNKNKELLNYSKKDVCYICALGPSLKDVDLSRINGDSIVVNRFYKIGQKFPQFIPTYYLMLDSQFNDEQNLSDFDEAVAMYSGSGTKYLLNVKLSSQKNIVERIGNRAYYLAPYGGDMRSKRWYGVNKIFPAFQNVVGAAILFAITLGYKKIVLLGCDFNSFATQTVSHCYESSLTKLRPLAEELFFYSIAAKQHDELRKYGDKIGVQIVNSTPGSLIDSYDFEIDKSLYNLL